MVIMIKNLIAIITIIAIISNDKIYFKLRSEDIITTTTTTTETTQVAIII
jgi:hypothetical protein